MWLRLGAALLAGCGRLSRVTVWFVSSGPGRWKGRRPSLRSDHQVRLNTVMIPVTVAKIMVPRSGTKMAQDNQSR